MGYAIAEVLADYGANVILVSGPTSLQIQHPNIKVINVKSAEEMYNASVAAFVHCHAAILSAAVADYTPVSPADKKLKREKENLTIELKPTQDIAKKLGELKSNNQILVGFALETNNEEANARKKIISKNLDFIVLNSLNTPGAGFQVDTNQVSIIDKDGNQTNYPLKHKTEVAVDIVEELSKLLLT